MTVDEALEVLDLGEQDVDRGDLLVGDEIEPAVRRVHRDLDAIRRRRHYLRAPRGGLLYADDSLKPFSACHGYSGYPFSCRAMSRYSRLLCRMSPASAWTMSRRKF